MIRALLVGAIWLLPLRAAAQPLIYALPGGASADNIATPNGFAASQGVRYAALSAHTEAKRDHPLDALAVFGFGSGPVESACEVSIITSDLDHFSGQFLSLKWHFHSETAAAPAVALGIEDVTAAASHSATPYIAATKTFWDVSARSAFLMRKAVSLGFGGGRFHRRLFGAVSVSLDAYSKAIAEYDGRGLNAGLSLAQTLTERAVVVVVLARQRLTSPSQGAWTMSVAVAWEEP